MNAVRTNYPIFLSLQLLGTSYFRNYRTELHAFSRRLGEKFEESTLQKMFPNIEKELSPVHAIEHQIELRQTGEKVIDSYVKAFLRYSFPQLPEEGIQSVYNYLTSDTLLSHISKGVGSKDLVELRVFPAEDQDMAENFKILVGGLAADAGVNRAELFVQDFVLTQLANVDNILEIWHLVDPLAVLRDILTAQNRGQPETRLIRAAGANTVTPVYLVGIYSDKELLGESAGETVGVAEDLAARESLRSIWGLQTGRAPLPLGSKGRNLDLTAQKTHKNPSLRELCQPHTDISCRIPQLNNEAEDEEPLDFEQMALHYREVQQPQTGLVVRKRLKHKFYGGSLMRRYMRKILKPKPHNI